MFNKILFLYLKMLEITGFSLFAASPIDDFQQDVKRLQRRFIADYRFTWDWKNYSEVIGRVLIWGPVLFLGLFLVLFLFQLIIKPDKFSFLKTISNIFRGRKYIFYKMKEDKMRDMEEKGK